MNAQRNFKISYSILSSLTNSLLQITHGFSIPFLKCFHAYFCMCLHSRSPDTNVFIHSSLQWMKRDQVLGCLTVGKEFMENIHVLANCNI